MHHIAENLHYYRKSNRYLQSEIAERLGITLGQMKSYEGGKAIPPVDILIRMADMMQITLDELVRQQLSAGTPVAKNNRKEEALSTRISALENSMDHLNKIVNKVLSGYPKSQNIKQRNAVQ